MNLSSPTQALQARAQPGGITPELIRLLAQMKVKQETDAAARDMAMKTGQQPPTVAEGLNAELEGNWRQKLEQKLGGLNALAQQQAPQGAPTMPAPPAQPTQHMARGGLAKLRSNLPGQYAGGGIVAFEDGGGVDEAVAGWLEKLGLIGAKIDPRDSMTPQERQAAALEEVNKANAMDPNTPHRGVGDDPRLLPGSRSAPADSPDAPTLRPGETNESYRSRFSAWLNGKPAAPAVPPGTGAAPRGKVPVMGSQAPVVSQPAAAPVSGLQAAYDAAAIKGINANPEAAGNTTADSFAARHQAALGADQAALRAARQQDYEQAKAAHEARMAKSAPSIWDRMSTLGKHAGYGQWGQAAGDQRTMELEHEARGASGLEALLKRKGEVDAMSLADKTGLFTGTEAARNAGRTATAAEKKDAMDTASKLLATQGTNATTLAATKLQGENQLAVQRLHNQGMMAVAEAKNNSDIKERNLQLKSATAMLKGAETAQLKLEADLMVPEAVKAEGRAKIAQLKQSIAAIGGVPMVDAPAAADPNAAKIELAKQELARRTKGT